MKGEGTMNEAEYRVCPYCSEQIKAMALKCRHCHSMLDNEKLGSSESEFATDQLGEKPNIGKAEKGSGLFDFLKVKEYKIEIERLENTKAILMKKMVEIGAMDIIEKEENLAQLETEIIDLENRKIAIIGEIEAEKNKLELLREELVVTDDEILLQSFGLYKPKYDFINSEQYKAKLDEIRQLQKELIKSGVAATGNMNWTVNGSKAEGKKMVKDMQKLLLRAFNSECENCISKVRYSNFEASEKRIAKAHEAISKLGRIMNVSISPQYYQLKNDELHLAFEYQQMKEQEKEEQRLIREQLREEAKLQKEIEEARKKVEKEQDHFLNALIRLNEQLENAADDERAALLAKKEELESGLEDVSAQLKDLDYREANQKAGYVYIISNIGSFGDNIYKIGVTRRLDPYERINELGGASVPFNFDVHAMIFCDDAYSLENSLHKAFELKKLNMVNTRREFFSVDIDEIKEVVKQSYDKTAEFIEAPEAEQFRLSEKMRIEAGC
jgi:hypothetical protein